MSCLETVNLGKDYGSQESIVHAVNGISLKFEEHRFYAITGRSGSGKSTFLRMCALLEQPTGGSVKLDGRDITAESDSRKARIRRVRFGYVFQDFNLLPEYTVKDNIMVPLYLSGRMDDGGKLDELAEFLGIDQLLAKMPDQLSGGQQQRTALARALIAEPDIIFADEPTGNLDRANGNAVYTLLKRIAHEMNRTVIMVTHDQAMAEAADTQYCMADGKIISGHAN